jgi:hypothetical protein
MNSQQNQPVVNVQQPAHYQNSQPVAQQPVVSTPAPHHHHRRWIPWTILIVVIIIILGAVGFIFRKNIFPNKAAAEQLSGYQAVFLTNGQVYFGKATHLDGQYIRLTSIYYLQTSTPAGTSATGSTASTATAANSAAADAATQLSLVKLGNELHGPADQMEINRDQVLFIEDLKTSGQVAQAIQKYQQTNGAAGAANSTPDQGTQQAPAGSAPTSTATPPPATTPAAPSTSVPATH